MLWLVGCHGCGAFLVARCSPPRGELTYALPALGQAFGKLREMLSKTKSADLRGLNFRLDFSEFYADLPAQPEDDLEQM